MFALGPPPPGGPGGGSGLPFSSGNLRFRADSGPNPGGNFIFNLYFGPKRSWAHRFASNSKWAFAPRTGPGSPKTGPGRAGIVPPPRGQETPQVGPGPTRMQVPRPGAKKHLAVHWQLGILIFQVFGRFSVKLGPQTPLERRGSSLQCRLHPNSAPQTNSKTISWQFGILKSPPPMNR